LEAGSRVSDKLKKSIQIAYDNINNFHKRQLKENLERKETSE
jgi:histidinol dehydrogenase